MKKILIFTHAMEVGGAERALLGLLENIDYSNYSVDLFLMRHTGEWLDLIPPQVHLLSEIPEYACLAVPIGTVLRRGKISVLLGRIIAKIKAKQRVKQLQLPEENSVELEYSHKYTLRAMPMINGNQHYDLAISFLTPHYFLAERVNAAKKVAWIHTDYSEVRVDIESEYEMWNRYDKIISISDSVTRNFFFLFPEISNKIVKIENMLPQKCIEKQAKEFDAIKEMPDNGSVRFLSIGRYCYAKNFDNIPDICRRLIQKGIKPYWYLIGYGGEEELIRQKIQDADMQNNVFILGKKDNPYPYILACDIYIQPSRYEGNSVTVHEAQLLGKPVIITDYATSDSQLKNGINGVIVPLDNESCANGIVDVLHNKQLLEKLCRNCQDNDYSNSEEIEKFYSLLD